MSNVPSNYDPSQYDRPSVTADVIMFTIQDHDLQVLLIRRQNPPFAGQWAIPGGFVDIDEPLAAAARRELEEETGLQHIDVTQLHTFGKPGRDPRTRVITVAYLALVPAASLPPLAPNDDASDARWWSTFDLPALAFDHAEILDFTLSYVRRELACSAIVQPWLDDTFSLADLQDIYEIVLDKKLDSTALEQTLQRRNIIEPAPQTPLFHFAQELVIFT